MRQTGKSVGKFGSQTKPSNISDAQSMKSSSVRGGNDSFDLEDFEDIMEKIQLDGAIELQKKSMRKLTTANEDPDAYKDNFLIKFFENAGDDDAFDFIGGNQSPGRRPNRGTRIPQPPTKEDLKRNQQKQLVPGDQQQVQAPQQTSPRIPKPKSTNKSILDKTNGNDDNWHPAWTTSQGAGDALEETKQEGPARKAEAFTDKPASSNAKLMDFEALLLQKAGKQPSASPSTATSAATVA